MALFGRKAQDPGDIEAEVASLARRTLAERGLETTVEGAPGALRLIDSGGMTYFVYNLALKCRVAPRRQWARIVEAHIDSMLQGRDEPDTAQLGPDQVRRQIRTRILPAEGAGPIDLGYARPLAPGLVVALCIDFPQTVTTLGSRQVAELGLPLDELYRFGMANTAGEWIDERAEIQDGVRLLGGGSLFIASKAADMQNLVETVTGPAPHGVLFAVPHRHVLLYAVPTGPELVLSVNSLLRLTVQLAHDGQNPPPGGVLSDDIYFWADGAVERIGGFNRETNAFAVEASGRFADVLQRLTAG